MIDVTVKGEMMERHDDTMRDAPLDPISEMCHAHTSKLGDELRIKGTELCVMTERMENAKTKLPVRVKRTMMERHDDTMRRLTQPTRGEKIKLSAVESKLSSKVLSYV